LTDPDRTSPAEQVNHDGHGLVAGFIRNLDLAGLDDEESDVTLAAPEERLPGPILLERHPGAAPQRLDLGRVERRECDGVQVVQSHV